MLDEVFLSRRGLSDFFWIFGETFLEFAGTLNSILNARGDRDFYTNITPDNIDRLPGQK